MGNKKVPTIRDIAEIAGVTPGTVSRALNDSDLVKEQTKSRILEIARDLDYFPNVTAKRLSTGKTFAIGIIVPLFTRPSVSERLDGVVSILSNSQYDLVINDIESPKQRSIGFQDILRQERIDGALLISMPILDEDIQHFRKSTVPIVFVDQKHPNLEDFNSITIDDVQGGYTATEYLIRLGHTKIGFIGDTTASLTRPRNNINIEINPFVYTASSDRYLGYKKALSNARIALNSDYFAEEPSSYQTAKQSATLMLQLEHPPTAIFAASDTQAFGVIQAARSLGLSIPEDLSVIGYDDIQAAEFMQLTTIKQLLFDSGRKGVEILLEVIEGTLNNTTKISLPTELVIRNTTAPPKF